MSANLSDFSTVLLDLDGTLCREDHPLPGAVELVRRLRAAGKKVVCLSNSTQSPRRIADRLGQNGIDIPEKFVFTAAQAAVDYCLAKFAPRPAVFNLATEGVAEMLTGRTAIVESPAERCDAVIIGNPTCVYATVPRMRVALSLLRRGAACLGICADRAFPSLHGLEVGSGATTQMMAYAADVKPIFFGKPQADFFMEMCRALNTAPSECVLVGDSLESDIGGGKSVGMATILSLSGVTAEADLAHVPSQMTPDRVVRDLTELL